MARVNKDDVSRFLEHNVDLSTKTIYFGYGELDGDCDLDKVLAAGTIKALHLLGNIRPEAPITLIINCDGGEVQQGLAIYDMIKYIPSEVHGQIFGSCQSMAAWVLQACDHRAMSSHSVLMIHDGEDTISGKKKDVKAWKKWGDRQDLLCRDILLNRIREKLPAFETGKLQRMLDVDTILDAGQALELGLIDEVLE